MRWKQCFFSKLVEVCEMEWIPDEDALYGEYLGSGSGSKKLKQLVYRSRAGRQSQRQSTPSYISR